MIGTILRTLRPGILGLLGIAAVPFAFVAGVLFLWLGADVVEDFRAGIALFALFVVAPCSIVLIGAGVVAGRAAPRGLVFALATAAAALGAVLMFVPFVGRPDWFAGLFVSFVLFGPLVLLAAVPAVVYIAAGGAELADAIHGWRLDAALQTLNDAGKARLDDLADANGLDVDVLTAFVADRVADRTLVGRLEPERRRWWSTAALEQEQDRLVKTVKERGEVAIDDVARDLDEDPETIRRWVYEVVHRGRFTGYVNWKRGTLYAAEASHLESGICPVCGGQVRLAGWGAARCRNCDSDLLLGAA